MRLPLSCWTSLKFTIPARTSRVLRPPFCGLRGVRQYHRQTTRLSLYWPANNSQGHHSNRRLLSHTCACTKRPTPQRTMDADELAEQFEDKASVRAAGGGRGGRKAAGGGGGNKPGGGKPGDGGKQREKQISMALSRLLRHQALNAGIKLDKEGYAPLDRVLQWGALRTLNVTVQEIIQVCADNEKQRFAMKPAAGGEGATDGATDPSHWLIRANQGHSIKLESEALLRPITLEADNVPPVVVHGTYFAFWPRIVESGGLRRMGRTHVHCSTGLPDDEQGVISGMRRDAEVLVYVDVRRSLEDGVLTWWISDNGVVLTEGVGEEGIVPAKYFKEVVGRKEDAGTLWKDGEWVADLPEELRSRPPPAKGGRGRGGGRGGKGGGRGRGKGASSAS